MKSLAGILVSGLLCFSLGCMPPPKTAAAHQQELSSTQERKMTLGLVQSSIKEGMSQADVATVLGSPNIVTQDKDGNDTWIYDKISTETSFSESSEAQAVSGGVGGGLLGAATSVLGGGAAGVSAGKGSGSSAGARSQTQKTLTVVIKFDANHLVSSIKSQSSSF